MKMSIHSVTKYVNLTDTIVVPAEWPAYAFQKLLVPLVEQVINAAGTGKPVVLQVLNTPAKLVKRHDRNRIQYFFEKVFAECVFFYWINRKLYRFIEKLKRFYVFQRAYGLVRF